MPKAKPDRSNGSVTTASVDVVSSLQRSVTMDHLRSAKKPTTKSVTIVLDPALAEAFDEARNRYELARIRFEAAQGNAERADELDEAKSAYDAATAAARESATVFVFRNIGRRAWDELVGEHLPIEEQQKKHRRANPGAGKLTWNPETFPPAAVAACLVDPALSAADVAELWDDENWNDGELMDLFLAAVSVNQQRRTIDLP